MEPSDVVLMAMMEKKQMTVATTVRTMRGLRATPKALMLTTALALMTVLFSFFLLSAVLAASDPSLPGLPTSFRTQIEATIVNKNYTLSFYEWVDEPNQRGRFDTYYPRSHAAFHETGFTSTIYNYATDSYIHRNDTGCFKGNLEDLGDRLPFGGSTGSGAHIGTTQEIFRFGSQFDERYMGQEHVRGMLCDHWQSTASFGSNLIVAVNWYFTAKNWDTAATGSSRVPVRVHLTGTLTGQGGHNFEHFYDYVAFHVGNASLNPSHGDAEAVYQIPCGVLCRGDSRILSPSSNCPSTSLSSSTSLSIGATTAVALGTLLIGLVIGLGATKIIKKKGAAVPYQKQQDDL
eukprot:m.25057 g.25057  ORF g.25057 m.25057 type:complete len:347 (-) comp9793_c0_seq1:571-1611(-)